MRLLLPQSAPQALRDAVAACREHFWLAAWLSALINILYLAPTIYMMQVYDRVVPTNGLATLFWMSLIVAIALVIFAILDMIRARVLLRASLRVERLMATAILDRLLDRRTAARGAPSTSTAMREFDVLRNALGGQPAVVLFDIAWTPVYLIVAFLIHPLIALVILLGGGLLVALTLANERHTRAPQMSALAAAARAHARQERMTNRADSIRAMGMRRAIVARQIAERQQGQSVGTQAQMAAGRYIAAAKFLRLILQSAALGLGAALAIERQISIGAIIAASVMLNRALQPIEQLVATLPAINQARQAVATLQRLFADTDAMSAVRTTLPDPVGHLSLKAVQVEGRDGGPAVLRDINFAAAPGQIVGIIGPSGAGKTTLARLLCGAIAPDAGSIRIDGAQMSDWDSESLGRHIGYLPQDAALLPGTVAENIARFAQVGNDDRTAIDARTVAAARAAGAHEMILALPGGYDRLLDIDGGGLSAGQRQRVALARALYGDPAILILDEPNSALDAEGEAALAAALVAARGRGATVIIIAQRSGILTVADQLLVIARGQVEAFGPRDEIMAMLGRRAKAANVVGIKGAGA